MFSVDLRTRLVSYPLFKEQSNWGGPACCQIAMRGYPKIGTSCYFKQQNIANVIQTYVKEPAAWYSDPFAVTKTMNSLCPPEYSWIDISGTDKKAVLYQLLCWMASYGYAALTCLNRADRWVVITYYEAMDDPRVVKNTTLNYISWFDPTPVVDGGGESIVPDYMWWQSSVWGLPVPDGQLWKGKWIGVGEPPDQPGTVRIRTVQRVGNLKVNPKAAADIAVKFMASRQRRHCGCFGHRLEALQAGKPMLASELSADDEPGQAALESQVRYYIVPFEHSQVSDDAGRCLTAAAVLVNAYSGRVEELRVFHEPFRYLSPEEARAVARISLGVDKRDQARMKLDLVTQPFSKVVSSAVPAWRVSIGDRRFFVCQKGTVLASLSSLDLLGG